MGQGDTYELEELGYSEGEDVPYESSVEREAPAVAWMKRNKKILLIAAAVTFCFIVALVIVFGFILLSGGGDSAHPESSGGDNSSDDNNTPPPLQLTDEERGIRDFWVASVVPPFLGSLNRTADPCDNFYEFACGGWIDKTVIPADKTGVYKSFTSIDDSNEVILKEILEAGWPLLGPMYDQCMDVDSIESKGAQPLWDFGLSLISVNSCLPTNNASSTFLAAIGNLHRYGLSALFDIQVSPDPADPSMNLFSIDQGGLGLPTRDYYFRNDSRTLAIQQAYKQHITNSFRLGSPQLTEQAAQSRAQQVYDFELQLAKASMSPAQHRDPLATYHKYTMAQLNQLTPGIQWQQYFDTIRLPRDVTELNVAVPEFFSSLADQLYEAKSEDLCAYLEWRLLEQTSSLLSSAFLDETHFYSNQLTGRSQNPPRWKMCMSITESILGELLGRYYVQQTFSGDSKVRAQELIDRIKEAFAEHLPEVDWMDKQTERAAQQKLDAVADKIGYPDKWDDLTGLNVAPDNFYMNVLNGWKYEFDAIIPQAGKPVDKSIWYMNPQDVNAYYDPLMNEMVFPAAILQPPFYHPRYPDALNFGGIGSVMGHELTHGFDDEGRNFDANGELHQWWTDESIMAFEERTECPIAVYSEFPLDYPGNIDGEQTLGENLADMGGVKDAYRAFMKHMQETRPYTSLYTVAEELFGLTNEQLFFAAYGQVWCSVMKEEIAVMRLSTDVHSPGKARVDVPLAQTEEFGKAFNCPINSAMNPQEKCTVW